MLWEHRKTWSGVTKSEVNLKFHRLVWHVGVRTALFPLQYQQPYGMLVGQIKGTGLSPQKISRETTEGMKSMSKIPLWLFLSQLLQP